MKGRGFLNLFLSFWYLWLHDRYEVQVYGDDVDAWFSNAIGRPCTLLRGSGLDGSKRYPCSKRNQSIGMCNNAKSKLNFVNEAQLLLISEQSVSDLNTRLSTSMFWFLKYSILSGRYIYLKMRSSFCWKRELIIDMFVYLFKFFQKRWYHSSWSAKFTIGFS